MGRHGHPKGIPQLRLLQVTASGFFSADCCSSSCMQGHSVPQAEPQFPEQLSILGHPAPRLWLPPMCSHYKKGQLAALANLNFYPHSRLRQVVNCLSIINTFYQTALSGTKNYTTNCEPIISPVNQLAINQDFIQLAVNVSE